MDVIPVLSEIDVASALGLFSSDDSNFFPSLFMKKEEVWTPSTVLDADTPVSAPLSDAEEIDMESTNDDASHDTAYVPPSVSVVVRLFISVLML